MDPVVSLFHRLRGVPQGARLFRAAMRARYWNRHATRWALDRWLIADLPGRGWAMRQRLAISAAWEADRSRLKYLEALLTDQPR